MVELQRWQFLTNTLNTPRAHTQAPEHKLLQSARMCTCSDGYTGKLIGVLLSDTLSDCILHCTQNVSVSAEGGKNNHKAR